MPASFTTLGPGTLTVNSVDYSCECKGASIAHEYNETGSERTMLCGDKRTATRSRNDTFNASFENDLTAAGLYAYLTGLGDDPAAVTFEYVPNTGDGATWSGSVIPLLPGSIGADEYGNPVESDISWPSSGPAFTFTPAA